MMNLALTPTLAGSTIAIQQSAEETKQEALLNASFVESVSNATEQDQAVDTLKTLKTLINSVEECRKALKSPVLDFGRLIDSTAKNFSKELVGESERIEKLVRDFQTLELAKMRAVEQAEKEERDQREKERLAALASAKSLDEHDEINERFNEESKALSLEAPKPVKPSSLSVKEDWEITVNDIWLLARAHSTCVKIEPLKSEIKALLNAGVNVAGITATKVVQTSVRTK